jgi:hypothetical protein
MNEPSLQDQQTVFDHLSKRTDLSEQDYVRVVKAKNAIVDSQFTRPPTSDLSLATRTANDGQSRLLPAFLEMDHAPTVREMAEQLLKNLEAEEQVSSSLSVFEIVTSDSSFCSSQAL